MKDGFVHAVCTSPQGGFPKYPQDQVVVHQYGIWDDYHCREMRPHHKKPNVMLPNDRHITLVGFELLRDLENLTGKEFPPGSLAENITTHGMGHLTGITTGTRIQIGENIMLFVSELNEPCKLLKAAHGEEAFKFCIHRRGLICVVEEGIGEVITPCMPILLHPPM
ncbi:MAG: hypothetical protein K0S38_820 [Candidatus Paceibacter sp.]|jgi:hypothetical protein|nr:hypothetical protein [Candidatus Paceibacter sp.]